MDTPLNRLAVAIQEAREALDAFERQQDEHSDEGNADRIREATRALEDFEGHVMDLVP